MNPHLLNREGIRNDFLRKIVVLTQLKLLPSEVYFSEKFEYLTNTLKISQLTVLFGAILHSETKQKFEKVDGRKEAYKVWSSSFERIRKNKTFVDLAFYVRFPDLIWVTSSTQNISVVKKTNLGIKTKNLHRRNCFL